MSNSALSSSTAFRSLLSCSGDTASLSQAEHWRRIASRWIAKCTWMMSLNAAKDKMIQDHKPLCLCIKSLSQTHNQPQCRSRVTLEGIYNSFIPRPCLAFRRLQFVCGESLGTRLAVCVRREPGNEASSSCAERAWERG